MAIVDVWDIESIPTDSRQTYSRYGDGADGYVSVTGCAGPEAYDWLFDDEAETVEVEVTQSELDPELRTYTFRADFPSYDTERGATTLAGSFDAR